jgi:SET domain-containing protein
MLIIKTRVGPSEIHGFGLFTEEDLRFGQVYWELNPIIDQIVKKEQMATLPKLTREYMYHYSWKDENGDFYISLDNDKFMNHADDANTDNAHPKYCFANRDIKTGEELTCDYTKFGTDWQKLRVTK